MPSTSASSSQPSGSATLSPPLVLTSSVAGPSSSRVRLAAVSAPPSLTADARSLDAPRRSDRRIPIYVRLVPRDIWLRLHVDLHATMGSVKDAVLERAHVPLDDPTLLPSSLDAPEGAQPALAEYMPRAFVARRAGLVAAPVSGKAAEHAPGPLGLWDATQSLERASARDRAKAAAAAVAANAILGGDAGKGGPGKLGSLGSGMPAMLAATTTVGLPSAAEAARKSTHARLAASAAAQAAAAQRSARPMASFSALGAVAASRAAQRSASAAAPPLPLALLPAPDSLTPTSERTAAAAAASEQREAGMDAYLEYTAYGLPGNAEAKRLEAEALARALGGSSAATLSPHSSADSASFDAASAGTAGARGKRPARGRFDAYDSDEEAGGSTSEEESLWSVVEDEAEASGAFDAASAAAAAAAAAAGEAGSSPSLSSDAGDEALRTQDEEALWGTQLEEANERRAREAAANAANVTPIMHQRSSMGRRESDASIAQSSERGRSGTITAASAAAARNQHAASGAGAPLARVGSSGETNAAPRMARVGSEELSLPHASTSSLSSSLSAPTASAEGSSPAQSSPARNLASLRSGGGRLAGIRLDEISAWDAARHPHSARYAVYSFANGHLMEDWRTVAAFHVRPFELLEVHYARHADRIHLPRMGEAATEAKPDSAGAGEGALRHQRDTSHAGNPALDEKYVEPFSEGWYYVLKPGSGSGKAQKAGLCMWKLRWVVIRGWRLSIFRQRPKRSVLAQANGVSSWGLNTIKWIVTERADGMTSPALGNGRVASDSISISFTSNVVSDYSLDEADFAGYNIVSLRALTEFDHKALFNILARAYWRHGSHGDADVGLEVEAWRRRAVVRATIAGKGGTVQPHRAGRKAGRNALARARLRPRGLSRSFDDADRWSSDSEEEIFSPSAALDHQARASAVSAGESSKSSGTTNSAAENALRSAALPQTPPATAGRRARLDSSTGGVTTISISPSDRSLHLRGSANNSSGGAGSPSRLPPSTSASGTLSSPSSTYNLSRTRGFSLSRGGRMATPSPEPGALASGMSNLSLSTAASSPASKWRNSSGLSASASTPRANSSAAAGGVGALSTPESATHSDALLQPHANARHSGSFGRARAHTVSAARPLSRNSANDEAPPLPGGAGQQLSGKASGLFKGFRKARG